MTIHHVFDRTFAKPDTRGKSNCMDRHISKEEALKYFVDAELGYGSRIVHIEPTEIQTTSRCMGAVDDMVFSGTAEEMADLVEIAKAYNAALHGSGTVVFFAESRDWKFNTEASAFLSMLASGNKPYSAALWHMLIRKGAVPNEAVEKKNVQSAFELVYYDGQDPEEVFELAGIQMH